jgi:DNA-binding LacI/PurR family transcriptional regulator
MTLKEISARAGVHVSTVSRILNSDDESFGSREVRERVWAIVKETGYVPNPNARALRQTPNQNAAPQTGFLACLFGQKSGKNNPFYLQASLSFQQRALSLGFAVGDSFDASESGKQPLGAAILGPLDKPATLKLLETKYHNLVLIGRRVVDTATCDQVICDGGEAARTVLLHLTALGHSRIAYIGAAGDEPPYAAYLDILRENGIKLENYLTAKYPPDSVDGGYYGADILLRQAQGAMPTAVFCTSDAAAIAAMQRFKKAKIKMPDQLSIVSIDNIPESGYVSPMLTTFAMPASEMGDVAAQVLVNRIGKLHKIPLKVNLEGRLIVRESVANLNERMYI